MFTRTLLHMSIPVLFCLPAEAQEASFQGLGDLPGGEFVSVADGVSADGTYVVGWGHIDGGDRLAFIWDPDNGMIALPDVPPDDPIDYNEARAVSALGTIVVGAGSYWDDGRARSEAVLWDNGTPHRLGILGGQGSRFSFALGCSPDGSVIVGTSSSDAGNRREAFRWEDDVMVGLGDLPGGDFWSEASDVSADGSIIVGFGTPTPPIGREACLWDNGNLVPMGFLPGGNPPWSQATGVTPDGSVIVGLSRSTDGTQAFRWQDGEMVGLGILDGETYSGAIDISDDGTVVLGWSGHSGINRTIIWDAQNGMHDLREVLENDYGLDLTGWQLRGPTNISADGTTIVGYGTNPDGNTEAWRAVIPPADTDGDGLLDSWESDGIPIEGSNDVYILQGADPMRKDIYVEVDAMVGLAPDATVPQMIIDAFANAPVQNPDGSTGITFHFDLDENDLPPGPWQLDLDTDGDGFNDWVSGFDDALNDHFGTPAEHGDAALLEAKGKAYRYCIFGHSYDPDGSGGIANGIPGHLFMVTLGTWMTYGGTVEQQAGTFMHELGHTLGLKHGGSDHIHHKPNYYSVMNYSWQTPKSNYPGWRLDFSHAALPTLDEIALNEAAGLGAQPGEFSGVFVPFNGPNGQMWLAHMEGGLPIDWNVNGNIDQNAVQQDLNYLAWWQASSPDQPLPGHDDWSNLVYDFRGTPGYANGDYGDSTANTEFTHEMHALLESIPAPGTGVVLTSVEVVTGDHLGGGIPEITKPDDGIDYHIRSGFGRNLADAHHSEVHIQGTAMNDAPALIDLLIESRIDQPSGSAQVRLFNWNMQRYDEVNQHGVGDENVRVEIEDIHATDYVDPDGRVDVSIKHVVVVPFLAFTFETFIDQVQVTVE